MFRQNSLQNPPVISPSELPSWADGFLYWVKQEKLLFGSNRKTPNYSRPVLSIKKHANSMVILPSTSKPSAAFYHLTEVEWCKKNDQRDSYLSYRYEIIDINSNSKAAAVTHSERINIINWLKN